MNMVMKGKSQTVLKHYDRLLDTSWSNTSFSRWTPHHKVILAL